MSRRVVNSEIIYLVISNRNQTILNSSVNNFELKLLGIFAAELANLLWRKNCQRFKLFGVNCETSDEECES